MSLFEIGSFDQPVDVAARPGDGEVYVVEQPGRVVAVTDLSTEVVLDITDLDQRPRRSRGCSGSRSTPPPISPT